MFQGSIKGHEHAYQLDDHHTFVTGKPMLVCGNTAAMVGEEGISWLSKHFQVITPQECYMSLLHNSQGFVYGCQRLMHRCNHYSTPKPSGVWMILIVAYMAAYHLFVLWLQTAGLRILLVMVVFSPYISLPFTPASMHQ